MTWRGGWASPPCSPPPPPATSPGPGPAAWSAPGPPHRHHVCHHQHQISRYTHLWSVMCYPDPVPTLPRLAEAGSACIQCMLAHAQMSDDWLPAPSPASPHHMSKITITATSALILGMTHLITFPLSSSLSHGVVNDHFRYILAILLKQNGLNTGRFWNVFSDSPLLTRSDLKLHTITQIDHIYMFSNSNTQPSRCLPTLTHWPILNDGLLVTVESESVLAVVWKYL